MRLVSFALSLVATTVVVGAASFGLLSVGSHRDPAPPPLNRGIVTRIWSVPVAGGRPTLLLRDRGAQDGFPFYRRGGRSILFVRPTSLTTSSLFLLAPGGRPRRLRDLPVFARVGYEPAADRLAVVRGDRVVLETVAGRRVRVLVSRGSLGPPSLPVWSADGRTIAFARVVRTRSNPYQQQIVVRRGGRTRVFPVWGTPSELAVSPHGGRIALDRYRGLALLDVRTGRMRLLVRGGSSPTWSPDGRTLAYRDVRGLVALDLRTGRRRRLVPKALYPTFAPDGRSILYITQTP
jgi:Tol biopolymer transport system component